jgi:hypothetical protein
MMEWTIPETVTAGSVIITALILVYTMVKQRTDPRLLELMKTQTDLLKNQDDNSSKDNERFAASYDKNTLAIENLTNAFGTLVDKINSTFEGIDKRSTSQYTANMQLIEKLIGHVSGEHDSIELGITNTSTAIQQLDKNQTRRLESLESAIKQKEKVDKGLVEVMGEGLKSQATANGEFLKLLKEIKDELKSIRESSAIQYSETLKRLDKTDQTVARLEQNLSDNTETKEVKHVQPDRKLARLDHSAIGSGGSDSDDSRNAGEAVPPQSTSTDTERGDDQSKSAI